MAATAAVVGAGRGGRGRTAPIDPSH